MTDNDVPELIKDPVVHWAPGQQRTEAQWEADHATFLHAPPKTRWNGVGPLEHSL